MADRLLIISMGVYPDTHASGILVHNLAKAWGKEAVVVAGQRPLFDDGDFDTADYPIYYLKLDVLPIKRGKKYTSWLSFSKNRKLLNRLIKKEGITHLLATFPDEIHMALGLAVAKQNNLPFYPWFHNTYLENRAGVLRRLAAYLQPKFFAYAQQCFAISSGMADFYQTAYPNIAWKTILHGFKLPATGFSPFQPGESGKVRFALTGSMNWSCLDAALRLARLITARPDEFELQIFGERNARKLEEHGINVEHTVVHGFLFEDAYRAALQSCDILLLPHGLSGPRSDVEYQTIFPTRTIPLLYANRPILAHSPEGVSFTRFLQENACAEVVSIPDEAALLTAIHKIVESPERREQLVKNALQTVSRFDVEAVVRKLKHDINFKA